MENRAGVRILTSNQCRGKQRFTDPTLAQEAAEHMQRRERFKVVPYDCPKCSTQHIGHTFPRERVR